MRAEDLAPTTVAVMEAVVDNAGHPLHASAIDEILSHALSGTPRTLRSRIHPSQPLRER